MGGSRRRSPGSIHLAMRPMCWLITRSGRGCLAGPGMDRSGCKVLRAPGLSLRTKSRLTRAARGTTAPDSYFGKASDPPPRRLPASRWLKPSPSRIARIWSGSRGMPVICYRKGDLTIMVAVLHQDCRWRSGEWPEAPPHGPSPPEQATGGCESKGTASSPHA